MSTIYEQNIEWLRTCHPECADYMENLRTQDSQNYPIEKYITCDEQLGLYQNRGEEGIVQFNSQYDAAGYAKRWADYVLEDEETTYGHTIFVYGLGSGVYIEALQNRLDPECGLFVYEPSLAVFQTLLEEVLLEELWHGKMFLVVKGFNDGLFRLYFEHFIDIRNKELEILISIPVYKRVFPEGWKEFYQQIEKINGIIDINYNSQINQMEGMYHNQMMTLPSTITSYSLADCLLKLPMNVPAIVVAAGPSLAKNIGQLKEAKNRALILAVDTALKPLLKAGIVPDLYFTTDSRKPIELFDDERIADIPLCTKPRAQAEIINRQRNRIFYTMYRGMDYLDGLLEKYQKCAVELFSGGTVAQTAFSFAVDARMNPIILVGQDLAFSDEKTHIDGTFRDNMNVTKKDEEDSIWTEDVYGKPVRTLENLLVYKEWYEERIRAFPEVHVIDATEGGVRIEGTEIMTLKDAIERECKETYDYAGILASTAPAFEEEEREEIRQHLKEIPAILKAMQIDAQAGRQIYCEMIDMMERGALSVDVLRKKIDAVNVLTARIDGTLEKRLIDPLLVKTEREALTGLAREEEDAQTDLKNVAGKGIAMFDAVIEAVDRALEDVPQMLQLLEGQCSDVQGCR